jgi:UTP--glucose-1-phosphate uridylyltransferase
MSPNTIADQIRERMYSEGIDRTVVANFLHMVERAMAEKAAFVPLSSVSKPDGRLLLDPGPGEIREPAERGRDLVSRAVVIKLNGGRSTTMGGEVPKGVLVAKNGRSYLEIIAGQIRAAGEWWNTHIPLVLMNSFFTHGPTMEIMNHFDIPLTTFIQSQVPRLTDSNLSPLRTGTHEDWAPPGHGDVYLSLKLSGTLDKLLSEGKKWAFISNLDNLAATLEPWIVGLLERDGIDFLLEVTDRTEVDRKGGTLVVRDGKMDLLEIAQVSEDEQEAFMDIARFPVFNTNNVWVNLEALSEAIEKGSLNLPIIRNHKTIAGTRIVQLETAMGAAVGSFPRSRGLRVGRARFFPTKKVEDLFLLQSDACILDSKDRLWSNPERPAHLPLRPRVEFGSDFLDSPMKMDQCFEDPSSVSLLRAASFEVSGPVFFERDVRVEGRVKIAAPSDRPFRVAQGTTLKDGNYP